jgi:hypothetical protein
MSASGAYPPGVDGSAAELNANPRPWESRTCGECMKLGAFRFTDGIEVPACLSPAVDDARMEADETRPEYEACEAFEAII